MARRRFYQSLYLQVLAAIILGALLGSLDPHAGAAMKPLGDGFVKLIKMLIGPVIFCTVVLGIAGMDDLKKVGKTGGLALLYFELMSTLALIVGLIIVDVLRPGAGMNIDPRALAAAAAAAAEYTAPGRMQGVVAFLTNIIPVTVVDAFAKGDILQVLFFSILFGLALQRLGGRDGVLFSLIAGLSDVLYGIVALVMRAAPLGAFGAMAATVGAYGLATLLSLGKLLACFYATCLIFILGVLGLVARLVGFSILRFIRYIREEIFIVVGTSSSESVLPRMIARLEGLGAAKSVVGLVIPTGYSFNLDGTSIYLTLAALFVAQATNTPLALGAQIELLLVLVLTSKGAAGVTGSGFIVLAATLAAVGRVPVGAVALLLGIDRFMSEARAVTNLIGNGVATLVVAKWCGQLDEEQLHRQLSEARAPQAGDSQRLPAR